MKRTMFLFLLATAGLTGACDRAQDDVGPGTKAALQLCEPTSCKGPTPGAPNFMCADGTTAGPVCAKDPAGACGWTIVSCGGQAKDPAAGAGGGTASATVDPAVGAPGAATGTGTSGPGAAGGPVAGKPTSTVEPPCAKPDPAAGPKRIEVCPPRSCPGPAPLAPSMMCGDGTVAGPACVKGARGDCGWRVLGCPGAPGPGTILPAPGGECDGACDPAARPVCRQGAKAECLRPQDRKTCGWVCPDALPTPPPGQMDGAVRSR
jgi:hypothetical protein